MLRLTTAGKEKKTKQEDKVLGNRIHLVFVISFVCHLVNYQKPHRVQLTQRQRHMCSNVGVWVMTLGQTLHHRPPDTHSSLEEITASMLAKTTNSFTALGKDEGDTYQHMCRDTAKDEATTAKYSWSH